MVYGAGVVRADEVMGPSCNGSYSEFLFMKWDTAWGRLLVVGKHQRQVVVDKEHLLVVVHTVVVGNLVVYLKQKNQMLTGRNFLSYNDFLHTEKNDVGRVSLNVMINQNSQDKPNCMESKLGLEHKPKSISSPPLPSSWTTSY